MSLSVKKVNVGGGCNWFQIASVWLHYPRIVLYNLAVNTIGQLSVQAANTGMSNLWPRSRMQTTKQSLLSTLGVL
jgi:hypothetical protein